VNPAHQSEINDVPDTTSESMSRVYAILVFQGAPRAGHGDGKQHHEDAIWRFGSNTICQRNCIDAMSVDGLDGRIDTDVFDRKAAEGREKQRKCLELIREFQGANRTGFDRDIGLQELAQNRRHGVPSAVVSGKAEPPPLRANELHLEGRSPCGSAPPTG